MNWVKANRESLEKHNYVLKADTTSNYWFGVSKRKIEDYKAKFGLYFNIILFGSEVDETDFYTIPYTAVEDLLREDNLYYLKDRKRWVGDIRNHVLRIRNSNTERNISEYFSIPISFNRLEIVTENQNDYAIENAKREVWVRINQSIFRQKILDNFQNRCCLTGITENMLLVASHIIPWADRIESRLSPHNGLCLSVLYDKLFDKGYFTFSDTFEVMITARMDQLSEQTKKWLLEISGKIMTSPIKYEISKLSIQYHRMHIYESF